MKSLRILFLLCTILSQLQSSTTATAKDCSPAEQSGIGCSDCTREGFNNPGMYPDVAGCSGGWAIPGMWHSNDKGETLPNCERKAGNDSSNPNGGNCNVEDLCAPGWHVCSDNMEFMDKSGCDSNKNKIPDVSEWANNPIFQTGGNCCDGSTKPGDPELFFATRQRGIGCGILCQFGTEQDSGRCSSGNWSEGYTWDVNGRKHAYCDNRFANDLYGCGNIPPYPNDQSVPTQNPESIFNSWSGPGCRRFSSQNWRCDNNDGLSEALVARKPSAAQGGVLCCKGAKTDPHFNGTPLPSPTPIPTEPPATATPTPTPTPTCTLNADTLYKEVKNTIIQFDNCCQFNKHINKQGLCDPAKDPYCCDASKDLCCDRKLKYFQALYQVKCSEIDSFGHRRDTHSGSGDGTWTANKTGDGSNTPAPGDGFFQRMINLFRGRKDGAKATPTPSPSPSPSPKPTPKLGGPTPPPKEG